MIQIKAGGHQSTSADRKPMNAKHIQAADALSGLIEFMFGLFLLCTIISSPSQQYLRDVTL